MHSLFVVLMGGAGLAIAMQGLFSLAMPTQAETTPPKVEEIRPLVEQNPFQNISLEARSTYIADLNTGEVLYSKNENEKLPLASITKLMTALVGRERMSESAVLTISKEDLSIEGDSGLREGERWRLGDLLRLMLLVSSNDAARAVATFVGSNGNSNILGYPASAREHFVQMMNEKAVALNLPQMQFFNESGLDVSTSQNGGYGTAREVALLFAEIWKKYPEIIETTSRDSVKIFSQDTIAHYLINTNNITGHIPGLIASKTGFTDLSGGNLAVIFDKGVGDIFVAVVLGSSYKGRFEDMQKLVSAEN